MAAAIPRPDPVPGCVQCRADAVGQYEATEGPRPLCRVHRSLSSDWRPYAPAEPAPVEAAADPADVYTNRIAALYGSTAATGATLANEVRQAFRMGSEAGVEAERARLLRLVREQAHEEARIKQEHEARAADLDRQADGERDKAERHDERREALCRLHEMIAKGDG